MTLSEVKAFTDYRNKDRENTGAVGKYGFIPSTLFGKTVNGVFNPGLVQLTPGINMNTKFTPDVQEKLASVNLQRNKNELIKNGIEITPGNLKMAWYIGPEGTRLIHEAVNSGQGNKSVAQIMMEHGHPVGKENRELETIKAKDFEGVLQQRMEKGGNVHPIPKDVSQINKGQQLSVQSKENKELKGSTKSSQTLAVINNMNRNILQPPDVNNYIAPSGRRESALELAQRGSINV